MPNVNETYISICTILSSNIGSGMSQYLEIYIMFPKQATNAKYC